MWDLPGPGLEPMSPVLAGGFLTIEPPEKPLAKFLILKEKEKNSGWKGKLHVKMKTLGGPQIISPPSKYLIPENSGVRSTIF